MIRWIIVCLLALVATGQAQVIIDLPPPISVSATPSAPTIACAATAGTKVTTASTTGGDGNAITYSMTGNTTDFTINPGTGVVNVASGGIMPVDCGQVFNNTIIATQP